MYISDHCAFGVRILFLTTTNFVAQARPSAGSTRRYCACPSASAMGQVCSILGRPSRVIDDGDALLPDAGRIAAYLMHREANNGTLYLKWSEQPVEGALAVLCPLKPPPKFKLKTNNGVEDLIKPANLGLHKAKYWEGFIMFIKKAKQTDGTIILSGTVGVKIWSRSKDGEITEIPYGAQFDCAATTAAACGSRNSDACKGVKSMSAESFASLDGKVCVKTL